MKKIWDWLSIENNRNVLSFLGTGIAVIIAGFWTYFTYFDQPADKFQIDEKTTVINAAPPPVKDQSVQIKQQPVKQPLRGIVTPTPFSGTYVGISTEGVTRLPVEINFTHDGEMVTGTYTLSGMLGSMQGTINGNAYNYEWQLGAFSGRGVSYIEGNKIEGTWGYYKSNNNAGTLVAQLQ